MILCIYGNDKYEPNLIRSYSIRKKWINAMKTKISLSNKKSPINLKWVFKIKRRKQDN